MCTTGLIMLCFLLIDEIQLLKIFFFFSLLICKSLSNLFASILFSSLTFSLLAQPTEVCFLFIAEFVYVMIAVQSKYHPVIFEELLTSTHIIIFFFFFFFFFFSFLVRVVFSLRDINIDLLVLAVFTS